MFSPFQWLRRQAAEAVVLGISDGVRAVAPDDDTPPADLNDLRLMLAQAVAPPKQLAAGDGDAPKSKRSK